MARLQSQYPNDEFRIVDQYGNPAQIEDFIAADPMAKKLAKEQEFKSEVQKRLRRCK